MTKIIEIEGIGETHAAALEAAGVATVEAARKGGSVGVHRERRRYAAGVIEWVNVRPAASRVRLGTTSSRRRRSTPQRTSSTRAET